MKKIITACCAVALALAVIALAGCGGGKESVTEEDTSPTTVSTSPKAKTVETSPKATEQSGPAYMLMSGTWVSEGSQGGPYYLEGGKIIFAEPNGDKMGAYEATDATHIRLVIFQDWMEDGWNPDDPSTYPWQYTEATQVDPNRVMLASGYLMQVGPITFRKL